MRQMVVACILAAFSSLAFANELPPKIQRMIELGEQRRKERITELQGGVRLLKARLKEQERGSGELGTGIPANELAKDRSVKKTQGRIDAIEREIEVVRGEPVYYPKFSVASAQVSDIGILADPYGVGVSVRITRIIDGDNAIGTIDVEPVWLQINTANLKVGKTVKLDFPLEVTGTTTHKMVAGGTRKLLMLEPFQLPDDALEQIRSRSSETERRSDVAGRAMLRR